eukprot:s37_g8.t1
MHAQHPHHCDLTAAGAGRRRHRNPAGTHQAMPGGCAKCPSIGAGGCGSHQATHHGGPWILRVCEPDSGKGTLVRRLKSSNSWRAPTTPIPAPAADPAQPAQPAAPRQRTRPRAAACRRRTRPRRRCVWWNPGSPGSPGAICSEGTPTRFNLAKQPFAGFFLVPDFWTHPILLFDFGSASCWQLL